MRSSPLVGLSALAILVVALSGVLGAADTPALSSKQPRESAPPASSLPQAAPSTTALPTMSPAEIEPDAEAFAIPAGFEVTTTITTPPQEASAATPSPQPAPLRAQPGAGDTSTTTAPPVTTTPPPAPVGGPNAQYEAQFAASINSYRSGNGLSGLSRDGSLDSRARAWAEKMAADGGLSHSNLGSLLPPWSAAGENVGMGGSVDSVFNALAGSSGHRANMLGEYTHFGVGVWVDASGVVWTAHLFTR